MVELNQRNILIGLIVAVLLAGIGGATFLSGFITEGPEAPTEFVELTIDNQNCISKADCKDLYVEAGGEPDEFEEKWASVETDCTGDVCVYRTQTESGVDGVSTQ